MRLEAEGLISHLFASNAGQINDETEEMARNQGIQRSI